MIIRLRKGALCWVAIVLPGFLLRSLIPIGFMPMFGPGHHVSLMLCEGFAPVPGTAMHGSSDMSVDVPMDMPMDMPMDKPMPMHPDEGRGAPHQDHVTCPYGAGPALAAMAVWAAPSLRLTRPVEPAAMVAQVTALQIAARAQLPRGPPVRT